MPTSYKKNCVIELHFKAARDYKDPYNEVDVDIEVTFPTGKKSWYPLFWAGEGTWMARICSDEVGQHLYKTVSSQIEDVGLHDRKGEVEVQTYRGRNPLFLHGRLRVSESKDRFEHSDGTPFFWIGDTWWMGLCKRLDFPDGFEELKKDRVEKGFNVVQMVAGPYPDMDSFDPRNENEAGYPFTENFASINPAFYDLADLKIEGLVKAGIVPCLVGMWGYYLPKMGIEKAKRFWRYLVARYGAYPVVWCVAGEGTMPYYLTEGDAKRHEESEFQQKGWTEVARYIREIDGYRNLITIHPSDFGRRMVTDPSVLDFDMLQTGHSDLQSVSPTVKRVLEAKTMEPKMPFINSEVNYEGILGRAWQNIQRLCFYHSVLNGTSGHTYGANGIWQMSTPDFPYGLSPHGRSWGNTPWKEAYKLPGSKQIGLGGKFIQRFEWWKLERHPEWVEPAAKPEEDPYSPSVCGIPGKLRIVYAPMLWNAPKIVGIEKGVEYKAYYFDPIKGEDIDLGKVKANENGEWTPEQLPPEVHDWLIVMEA